MVASAGTLVKIKVSDTTVNVAGVPLNVTLVVPVRSVPRMWTGVPTLPNAGSVSTKGLRPKRHADEGTLQDMMELS